MKTQGISQNKKDINIMVMHNSNKGFDKTSKQSLDRDFDVFSFDVFCSLDPMIL